MKEQLAALIEAYSAAQASGNSLLQQFATSQLNQFLTQVEIVKITPVETPGDGYDGETPEKIKPRAKTA